MLVPVPVNLADQISLLMQPQLRLAALNIRFIWSKETCRKSQRIIFCGCSVSRVVACLFIRSDEHVPREQFGFYSPEQSNLQRTVIQSLGAITAQQPVLYTLCLTNDSLSITLCCDGSDFPCFSSIYRAVWTCMTDVMFTEEVKEDGNHTPPN